MLRPPLPRHRFMPLLQLRATLGLCLLSLACVHCNKEPDRSGPSQPEAQSGTAKAPKSHSSELPSPSAKPPKTFPSSNNSANTPPSDAGTGPNAPGVAHKPPLLIDGPDGKKIPAANAKRVLHVGDSMVPLVGNFLRPIFQADKRTYDIDSVISSSTLSWSSERLLQKAMYKYDPDLVLISLGSNELFDRTPERRAAAIQQIVADTRGRPCLWLGPPAWKEDYGFIEVLKANLGHCHYLDAISLKLPRMEDGRHPSWTGGHRWATATWKYLGGETPVPTGSRSEN